mgnify:CR=1 FL=1
MLKSDVRSSPVAGTVDITGADGNFCGRQSLTARERLTPGLAQGLKINSLVQVNGHAAAKPGGNAGRSSSCKGRWLSAGYKWAGKIPAKRSRSAGEDCCR